MSTDRRQLFALLAGVVAVPSLARAQSPGMSRVTAFAFSFAGLSGGDIRLADYVGKPILVVNTASLCGYTPQYAGLQQLWARYHDRGLMIIGVPSNDFGAQEPGPNAEIAQFCETRFGVTFPMFEKIDVNGDDAHPLFKWLRTEKSGVLGDKIKWNFTKFLVGKDGSVLKRYGSSTKPEKIAGDIEKALAG